MANPFKRQPSKKRDDNPSPTVLPPFEKLSEKELTDLYNLAKIRSIEPGEILIREGDTDQTAYIILEGQIKIFQTIHGEQQMIGLLAKGDWVGEISFVKQIPRTATAQAALYSKVMIIDQHTLNVLNASTQLHFYKHLNDLAADRITRSEQRISELSQQNTQLVSTIFDQHSRRLTDLHNMEMILDIVKKIPQLPVFATTLASDIMSDRIQVSDIALKIKSDPSLAGIVLKVINSSYYGLKQKISDIQHAILLLGLNKLYQLIIAEGVRQTMPRLAIFRQLHNHCMEISQIAFAFSEEKHIGKPSQMATIGLMHDLGQIVIVLLKRQNPKLGSLIDLLDPAQIGGLLLKSWQLPEIVWKSIEFQFYPEFTPPNNIPGDIQDIVAMLYITHLSHENLRGIDKNKLSTTFLSEYKKLLNLETYSLEDISHKIILPGLKKRMETLPVSLRTLIGSLSSY